MGLREAHTGHTHPHICTPNPPQTPSSKAHQTTTYTCKISAYIVRSENQSREERHVTRDIRINNQSHSRRGRHIYVVWTSSRLENGSNTHLNSITTINSHRKPRKRSKTFFGLLCHSPKCRSEVPCKWHDTGNAFRRFILFRTRIKKQGSQSLLLVQMQQWKNSTMEQ